MGAGKHKQNRVQIDEALFSKIEQGDDKAFEELYHLTYKPMYAFVLSMALPRKMQRIFCRKPISALEVHVIYTKNVEILWHG